MISSFFQLGKEVLKEYIKNRFASEVTVKADTPEFTKWEAGSYVFTVTEISTRNTLVNVVRGSQAESISIEWDKLEFKLPIKEVSEEQKEALYAYLDSRLEPPKLSREEERKDKENFAGVFPEGSKNADIETSQPSIIKEQRRPADMPDFEDEYEVLARSNPRTDFLSSQFPSIGDRDLNPPGLPRDPLMKPYIDPLAAPEGGMHPTKDHPLFGRQQQGNTSRLGVPPGARFDDPYGEDNLENMGMGLPGNLRKGGPGGPGGPSGSGGPGFGPGGSSGFGGSGYGGSGGFGGNFGF